MMEKNYSPSALKDWYEAPRHFKALMNGCISHKLDQLAKEHEEIKKMKNKNK